MISRKELLKSKEYWLAKFQSELYEQVEKYLEANNLTRSQFAEQLGVSKGYVSQIMNGDFDHKISKLIELSIAINKAPTVRFQNLDDHISSEERLVSRNGGGFKKRYLSSSTVPNSASSMVQDTEVAYRKRKKKK